MYRMVDPEKKHNGTPCRLVSKEKCPMAPWCNLE